MWIDNKLQTDIWQFFSVLGRETQIFFWNKEIKKTSRFTAVKICIAPWSIHHIPKNPFGIPKFWKCFPKFADPKETRRKKKVGESALNSASGGSDWSNADVSESDGGVLEQVLHILRAARSPGAWTAGDSGLGGWSVERVVRVEPEHRCIVVIPKRKDQDHSSLHSLAHLNQASLLLVVVAVSEKSFRSVAHGVSDGIVVGQAWPSRLNWGNMKNMYINATAWRFNLLGIHTLGVSILLPFWT